MVHGTFIIVKINWMKRVTNVTVNNVVIRCFLVNYFAGWAGMYCSNAGVSIKAELNPLIIQIGLMS